MPKYIIKLLKHSPKLARQLYSKWLKSSQPLGKEFTQGFRTARHEKLGYQKAFNSYVKGSKNKIRDELLTDKSFDKFVRNVTEGYRQEIKFFDNIVSRDSEGFRQLGKIWGNHYHRNSSTSASIPLKKWNEFKRLWTSNPQKAKEFIKQDMFPKYLNRLKDPVKLRKLYNQHVKDAINNTKIQFRSIPRSEKSIGYWMPETGGMARVHLNPWNQTSRATGYIRVDPSRIYQKHSWGTLPHEIKHGVQGDLSYRLFPSIINNTRSVYSSPVSTGANSLLKKAGINVKKGADNWFRKGSEKSAVLSEYRTQTPLQQFITRKVGAFPTSRFASPYRFGIGRSTSKMFGGNSQLKAADKVVWGLAPPGLLGVSVKEDKR